eukprot:sb/3474336/
MMRFTFWGSSIPNYDIPRFGIHHHFTIWRERRWRRLQGEGRKKTARSSTTGYSGYVIKEIPNYDIPRFGIHHHFTIWRERRWRRLQGEGRKKTARSSTTGYSGYVLKERGSGLSSRGGVFQGQGEKSERERHQLSQEHV